MAESVLISALNLFAGVSLMPAVFITLRDKEIPLDRNYWITGGMEIALALILLAPAVIFVLNVLAQVLSLFIALVVGLIALPPLLLIRLDKRRQSTEWLISWT